MIPLIDPMDALAAVQKAVKMVKEATKTANDVAQLGPVIGNYFDAKHQAQKAAKAAKKKGGSNLGAAVQVEMALMEQEAFEKQLADLFFSSNNMDRWQNIQRRVQQMNEEDKADEEREKIAEIKRKRRQKEIRDAAFAGVALLVVLCLLGAGFVKVISYCAEFGCS